MANRLLLSRILAALLAFWVLFLEICSAGELLGAFVMPHGGIALDPRYFNTTNSTAKAEAWALHEACQQVGREIAALEPSVILLSTPHGVADLSNFQFYLNPRGYGWADTDNCDCPPCCYNVSAEIDGPLSLRIIESLLQKWPGANVSGLAAYGPPAQEDAEPFPLRWGEVIPLHFILPHSPLTRVMVLSQPSRRYNDSVAMIPELLQLGHDLQSYIKSETTERVVVVISADLAHTHLSSGPYGYSNASEPFDLAVGEWVKGVNGTALLETAAVLVDRALSCGYTGLVMLHGVLQAVGLSSWVPRLYANYHPSYYGMMVASFLPK
ncbi:hypothetical protein GBAR_LOCUS919 [Geodia barretti]|uniref:Extradiol ring-cleavage dioxygenase class III enzyme subunit B domain-containing protein n=1 Tax=Geodia barretti TaxID=519541 RepID=A0AA35QUB7_GEOBA|nr:hypothetical protein GBAR_LOCUS919 [Geodia barretti]